MTIDPEFFPIDFQSALNEEQYKAVTAQDGPSLVLAGAGSGKTRTLTYRVAYLLHSGVQPHEILLLTFTNKAAKEMLERVEDLTSIPKHKLWGGTFHSIGQRILRMHGEAIGLKKHYNIIDESESEDLLKNSIQAIDPKFIKTKDNPKAKVISNMISYARNTQTEVAGVAEDRYPLIAGIGLKITEFYKHYKESKLQQQVTDYDDLLDLLLKLFKENPEIASIYQNRFKYILVDEFQDTNRLQSDIVDAIAIHHQVMAVGDDAQCIYTWRGANHENIMGFSERHPDTVVHKIETNYRSTPEILNFANAILKAQPSGMQFSKELKAIKPSGQLPYFVPLMDGPNQAQFLLKRIHGLLEEGYNYSDMAILYRAHYQSMDIQMELSRQNIDYQITSGVRFFEQAHIKDLVSQIRFASNPADVSAFKRFTCLLPKVGPKTAEKLHSLCLIHAEQNNLNFCDALKSETIFKKVPKLAQEEWDSLTATLAELSQALEEKTPEAIVELAVEGWYSTFIREIYPNWQEREEDLVSLIGFAARYDTLEELLAQLVLLSSELSNRSEQDSKHCLRLTTVHQAKGLEFPIVFIIGLADGLFPLKRTIDEGDLEEARRLFYVAATRAQEELYLCYPMLNSLGNNLMRMNPSRFVQEIDPSLFQTLKIAPNRRW